MEGYLFLIAARSNLCHARELVRRASTLPHSLRRHYLLARARSCMRLARGYYRDALICGPLTHHYVPDATPSRWRAEARIGNAMAWRSVRTYGRRQSAQRAAWAWIARRAQA